MSRDALESGLEEEVIVLKNELRCLKLVRRATDAFIASEKSKAGLSGHRNILSGAANLDLKPPSFCGDTRIWIQILKKKLNPLDLQH